LVRSASIRQIEAGRGVLLVRTSFMFVGIPLARCRSEALGQFGVRIGFRCDPVQAMRPGTNAQAGEPVACHSPGRSVDRSGNNTAIRAGMQACQGGGAASPGFPFHKSVTVGA
jgi:hypothetical protein